MAVKTISFLQLFAVNGQNCINAIIGPGCSGHYVALSCDNKSLCHHSFAPPLLTDWHFTGLSKFILFSSQGPREGGGLMGDILRSRDSPSPLREPRVMSTLGNAMCVIWPGGGGGQSLDLNKISCWSWSMKYCSFVDQDPKHFQSTRTHRKRSESLVTTLTEFQVSMRV